MGKVLGIDYGTKRIGLAVSDPLGMVATPVSIVDGSIPKKAFAEIREYIKENRVEKVVVGMPLHMNGTRGELAEACQKFSDKLAGQVNIPVETWDERLTSKVAERVLLDAGASRARRKQVLDKLAAQQLLQSYLDAHGAGDVFPDMEDECWD